MRKTRKKTARTLRLQDHLTDHESLPRQAREKQRKQRLADFNLFELVFRVWWKSEEYCEAAADLDERLSNGQLWTLERALAIRLIKATINLDDDTMVLVAETLKSLRDEPVDQAVATYFARYGRGKIKDIRKFVAKRLHRESGWRLDKKGNLSPANQKALDRSLEKFPFVRIRARRK